MKGFIVSYDVQFDADKGIVYTVASGPMDADYAAEFSIEALKVAEKNNCEKFLFDIRGTIITELAAGISQFALNLEKLGSKKSHKSAIVYASDEKDLRFFESTFKGQGFNVSLFNDLNQAIAWLTED
jgi:hypothetical protein